MRNGHLTAGPAEAPPPTGLRLQSRTWCKNNSCSTQRQWATPLAEDLTPTLVPHPALETHPAFLREASAIANRGKHSESRKSREKGKVIKHRCQLFQVVRHKALKRLLNTVHQKHETEWSCSTCCCLSRCTLTDSPVIVYWGLSGMSRPEYLQGLWRSRHLTGLLQPYKASQSGREGG